MVSPERRCSGTRSKLKCAPGTERIASTVSLPEPHPFPIPLGVSGMLSKFQVPFISHDRRMTASDTPKATRLRANARAYFSKPPAAPTFSQFVFMRPVGISGWLMISWRRSSARTVPDPLSPVGVRIVDM